MQVLIDAGLNAFGMQLFLESVLSSEQRNQGDRELLKTDGLVFPLAVERNGESAAYIVTIQRVDEESSSDS